MKFTALPVNVGDSFLLQTENKIIIVDGGKNKSHILKLLTDEKIKDKHIDLLICTHYDADHINGIIGIIKSQKFTFTEIWLPEILGSIGYTISKKLSVILEAFRSNSFNDNFNSDDIERYFSEYEIKEILNETKENNSFEEIDNDMLNEFIEEYEYLHHRWWYYPIHGDTEHKMMRNMYNISSLINYSLNSGAYIRWFSYQNKRTHISYGFNMFCENSLQTDITLYDEQLFSKILYLTTLSEINKKSLVFMYENDTNLNILFTADSNLDFYSAPITLKDNSVITAPHHGSSSNNNAYSKINGKDLIFVRSDQSQIKRPGIQYLSQKNRYCTICKNKTPKQKVELTQTGSKFKTNARACIC